MNEESMRMPESIENFDDGSTNHDGLQNRDHVILGPCRALQRVLRLVDLKGPSYATSTPAGRNREPNKRSRHCREPGKHDHRREAYLLQQAVWQAWESNRVDERSDHHGGNKRNNKKRDIQENGKNGIVTISTCDADKDDIETGKRGESVVPEHQCDNDDDGGGDNDSAATTIVAEGEVYLSLATIHPCGKPDACESRKGNIEKSHLDGQCVICLDFFQAGDTIVYNINTCPNPNNSDSYGGSGYDADSSNPIPIETPGGGCSHVYHKTCLVQYLANRKISEKGLRDGVGDTPSCPTCRELYSEILSILSVVNDNDNDRDSDNEEDAAVEGSEGLTNHFENIANVDEEDDDSDNDFEPQLDVHG